MNAIRFTITGRVQGVGFRAWTRSVALRTGITGSVRNRPDGAVEIDASGSEAALATFRAALRNGPPLAEVLDVSESPIATPSTHSFTIEY